jgi:hypothetical protein
MDLPTDRTAGSDAERRAALALRDRLTTGGRAATVEPFRFHQRWALAQALAAALGVAGSVLAVTRPALGTTLVAVAAASSVAEAQGVTALLARLTGTRASQNVSAPRTGALPARPGLLVIAATYDAPRDSLVGRLARRLPLWPALGAAFVAALACCVLRLLDFEGDLLTAIQLVPTLVLLAAVPLLGEAELAPVGKGSAEAAGVEVATALAERLERELLQLDVWLVLAGGGALGAGMRAWRRRHRAALNAQPAVTIEIGAPEPGTVAETVELYAGLAHGLDAELRG